MCVCVQGDVSDFILNAAGLLPAGVDWDGSMCDVMSVTGVVSVHGDCGLSWAVWSGGIAGKVLPRLASM